MSQSNVEAVRDQYEATNERDFERAMSHYADDVELVVPDGIRAGTFKGRDAVGQWFGDWFSTFRDARFDLEETAELERDRVLVVASHHARGRASGVETHWTVIWLYTLRDGKVIRVEGFASRDEALEAAQSKG